MRGFAQNTFFYQAGATRRLLHAAIPTIFHEFPTYLQKKKAVKKSFRQTLPSSSSEPHSPRASTSTAPEDQDTPRKKKLRRQLFQQSQKLKEKTTKLRVLGQKLKRYKKKILSLKLKVKDLNKKDYFLKKIYCFLKICVILQNSFKNVNCKKSYLFPTIAEICYDTMFFFLPRWSRKLD